MLSLLLVFSCTVKLSTSGLTPAANEAAVVPPEAYSQLYGMKDLMVYMMDSSSNARDMLRDQYYDHVRKSRDYVNHFNTQTEEMSDQLVNSLDRLKTDAMSMPKKIVSTVQEETDKVSSMVYNLYGDLAFDASNFRFHVPLSEISSASVQQMCSLSKINCDNCNRFDRYVMCSACCSREDYSEPVYINKGVEQETGSSAVANEMFMASLKYLGLHSVYQAYENQEDEKNAIDESDVKSVINNFNWENDLALKVPVNLTTSEICGHYLPNTGKEGRVVGGDIVKTPERYPWQVSLATGFFGQFYQHRCGASIINEKWVLTAAHCMKTLGVKNTYVMSGFLAVNGRDTAQIRRVEKFFVHEDFISELYEQDIALLKLVKPFVFNSLVLPVCLPPPNAIHEDLKATLTGWGRQWNDGPLSDQLRKAELPLITNEKCMNWYAKSGSKQLIPESTFLCAGYKDGHKDACNGDSGGPLVVFRKDKRAEVVGLVSWGVGCGVAGRPGVYTRISMFIDWIYKIMDENQDSEATYA